MTNKNFVEIQPVLLTDNGPVPIYSDAARGKSRMTVTGPGAFDLSANSQYVAGAYENLQHHVIRDEIEARGLKFDVGQSHLFEINNDLAQGAMTFSGQNMQPFDRLPALLGAAARAGQAGGATHVEIKIS